MREAFTPILALDQLEIKRITSNINTLSYCIIASLNFA